MEAKGETWFGRALEEYRISVPALAKAVGISVQQIYKMKTGERGISPKRAGELAAGLNQIIPDLNITPTELLFGPQSGKLPPAASVGIATARTPLPSGNAGTPKPAGFGPKVIPVIGKGDFTLDFDGFILDGVAVDQIGCPPGLETVPEAYACRVHGPSMSSRFEAGDTVFVNPHLPAASGDYVVVQVRFADRDAPVGYIKRLVQITAREVILEQSNPKKQIKLLKADVMSIHKVVFIAIK